MDKKIFTLHRSPPSRILLCGIRKYDISCRARNIMKEDENNNRKRRRRTKRKANFTERKRESRRLVGDGIQKQEN
jgi:hypothetical protein